MKTVNSKRRAARLPNLEISQITLLKLQIHDGYGPLPIEVTVILVEEAYIQE